MATYSKLTVSKVAGSSDILAATSKVQIKLTVTTTGDSWNAADTTRGYIDIDGTKVASLDKKRFYKQSTTTIYSGTHTVQHNADGTKTIKVHSYFDTDIAAGVLEDTVTLKLDDIPRVALLVVPVMTLGQQVTIPVTNSAGLDYSVHYAFGAQSGTIVENSHADEIAWVPPLELAQEIPGAPGGKGTLTVTSYRAGEVEAQHSYEFTALVPDSLSPVIKSAAFSFKADNATVSGWGVGVKGKTRLSYSVEAEGQQGAEIASCSVSFGGASGAGLTGETGVLLQAGTFVPKVSVTDKRGKTSTLTGNELVVYDYTTPAFISSAAYRADEDGTQMGSGTYVAVMAAASYAPVGGHNSATLKARSRVTDGMWGEYTEIFAQQVNVLPNFSGTMSYEVEVCAIDALGESRSVVYSIPTEEVSFHLRQGGKGAAFGRYSEREGYVETAWPVDMLGNRVENVGSPVNDGDAANKAYVDAPDMLLDTEYALNEKWNGEQVYAMIVDYGSLPNSAEGSNYALAPGLNVIDIRGFAVGEQYIIPIPGYYAILSMGYNRATGNLWIATTIDMSGYHGYVTVKYTK